jgi:hypothetical protein
MSSHYARLDTSNVNRLASGLFFRFEQNEQVGHSPLTRSSEGVAHDVQHDDFVVPECSQTKEGNELYLPLLEVSVEVEVMGTIAWTKLTQTFTNRTASLVNEATYCFPLYDKSTVTDFTCSIGSDKVLKGVVKPKSQAKAEFKAAVARQRVAALLEEHTPEVFETSVGNIPARSTVKVEICYITELKADLSGDGVLVTIPTSVAPRYGAPPISLSGSSASAFLAVPPENGLQIQIQVSSPVAINRIESRTHPVTIEMGSHGQRTTRNIRDLASSRGSLEYDPKKARATLSDRSACLGKDFVLLVQCRGGTLLASRATQEPHPKLPDHSALMVSINLRDVYTPDVVSPKSPSEIIFFADRSGSMWDKMDALKTAIGFFLKSLPNNCFFNICSFGSNHVFMWPNSRPYNQQNLDESISYVTTNFEANMGGTELLSGLRKVVLKRNRALNTQVIILTDGEVWDSANTFDFIRNTRVAGGEKEIRFFALGIGDAVSHQLVEGIGRHGGGLAEVVSVDSRGDWKGRVIRMLEAALTPSTWKIEISLDDVSILRNWKEQRCIQAPYHIPEFHAFSRSSIYFLFSQAVKTKSVKFKATATSGETVTANLPFQSLESSRTCVHLLAAKSVLNDLENGQSWMHAISQENNGMAQAEVEDLARAEGERIGTEWSLPSKWTSFVVVDNIGLLEKTSRLYQAEVTELAELTRTRSGATNYPFPDLLAHSRGSSFALPNIPAADWEDCRAGREAQSGACLPPTQRYGDRGDRGDRGGRVGGGTGWRERDDFVTFHPPAQSYGDRGGRGERGDRGTEWKESEITAHAKLAGQCIVSKASARPMLDVLTRAGCSRPIKNERQQAVSSVSTILGPARPPKMGPITEDASYVQSSTSGSVTVTGTSTSSLTTATRELNPNAPAFTPSTFSEPEFGKDKENGEGTAPDTPEDWNFGSTMGYNGLPKETGDSELMPAPENRGAETLAEGVGTQQSLFVGADSPHRNSLNFKDLDPSPSTSHYDRTGPQRMDSRNHGRVGSARQKKLAISERERRRITKYIALEELIYAQTTDGRFDLNNDLGTAVKNQFKHWRFDILVSELGESMVYKDMDKVLETARTIVLIEVKHADAQDSWKLVIQKARAFVSTVIRDEKQRENLFGVLQNQLSADREMVLHALKTSRWLLSHRKLIDGILRSHILDDPKELLNILRTYAPLRDFGFRHLFFRQFGYKMEELVRFLGNHVLKDAYQKARKEKSRPSDSGIDHENPDEWTDGWDNILNLLEAVNSVMQERSRERERG